jgi:hypothetical protein
MDLFRLFSSRITSYEMKHMSQTVDLADLYLCFPSVWTI